LPTVNDWGAEYCVGDEHPTKKASAEGFPRPWQRTCPSAFHANLIDEPDLPAGFAVWLCSGKADWAKGRYLSCNWDVDELTQLKDQIIQDDLLVNRLRTKA
jgi:hypothetical protein